MGYGKLTVYLAAAAGAGKTSQCWIAPTSCQATASTSSPDSSKRTDGRKRRRCSTGLRASAEDDYRQRNHLQRVRPRCTDRSPSARRAHRRTRAYQRSGSRSRRNGFTTYWPCSGRASTSSRRSTSSISKDSATGRRLTGTIVRETLPDGILPLADEVILIDVTPDTLRQRLREGKIYPPERVDAALANFFRTENLVALRELAIREALRARFRERIPSPFERILLSVRRAIDELPMIARAGRIAARLAIDFAIAPRQRARSDAVDRGGRRTPARRSAQDERRMDRERPLGRRRGD